MSVPSFGPNIATASKRTLTGIQNLTDGVLNIENGAISNSSSISTDSLTAKSALINDATIDRLTVTDYAVVDQFRTKQLNTVQTYEVYSSTATMNVDTVRASNVTATNVMTSVIRVRDVLMLPIKTPSVSEYSVNGAMCIDEDNMYVRIGGVWKFIALSTLV
jgi:hypothetical protein